MKEVQSSNLQLLVDCLSAPIIKKSTGTTAKSKKARHKCRRRSAPKLVSVEKTETTDADELADFIHYLATEIYGTMPYELRTLTYSSWFNSSALQGLYPNPPPSQTFITILNNVSPNIIESLVAYGFVPAHCPTEEFLVPILNTYLTTILTATLPQIRNEDAVTECEICKRYWIPLTFHHLIPKAAHARVLKRGWHTLDKLENVAWLCRACHSFVHGIASNETLAREFYSVERLLEREDVARFASWVGKIRWKAK